MSFPWVIVGGTGYDVEDVDRPQTREMQCPACDKPVRFVEKLLIKNLRVFGVPIVGVEKGRRVFECPHCKACIEPDASQSDATEEGLAQPPSLSDLLKRVDAAEFDIELWSRREKLAHERGETDLQREASERRESARAQLDLLREEIESFEKTGKKFARAAKPPVVFRAGDAAPTERAAASDDREFAALKARLAARPEAEGASGSGEVVVAEGETAGKSAEENSSTSTSTGESAAESAGAGESAGEKTREAAARPAEDDVDVESEFRALRERMKRRGAGDAGETARDPAEGAASSAGNAGNAGDEDDPIAALKRKLRK